MKWFKHMADMSLDVKIKRLIRKYGVEGYGLYNYILENIVRMMDSEKPMPELESDAEDIAHELKMDTVRVEEIMLFCIHQELFDQSEINGRIVANKIYKFLSTDVTRNPEIKKMIAKYSEKHSFVPDSPGQPRTTTRHPKVVGSNSGHITLDYITLDNNKEEESAKAVTFDSKAYELAELLYSLHKTEDEKYKVSDKSMESWAVEIDKLNRIDERSWDDIERVIRWAKRPDSFWFTNIMSGKKLRQQFPKLLIQSNKDVQLEDAPTQLYYDQPNPELSALVRGNK